MPDEPTPSPEVEVHRTADFVSRYANNIRFEAYGSDLKILFGQSDQASGKEIIEQHTAITLSWAQVKLAIYFLKVQLAIYEAQIGVPVILHPVSIPSAWPDEVPETGKNDPKAEEALKHLQALREQLISSLTSIVGP
jgi:hypothetical protein